MQINIPDELFDRLRQRANDPAEASQLILDDLDREEAEIAAIREGLEAADGGRVKPLEVFERGFRDRNGMTPEPKCLRSLSQSLRSKTFS